MQKTKKEALIKKLRAAEKRIHELNHEIRNIKPTPLKKRMFVGHWRHFTVRADVLRSSIGEDVAKIVSACDHWVLGKKKEEKSYRTSTEALFGEKTGTIAGQALKPINQKKAEAAGFSPEFLRKWFDKHTAVIGAGTKTYERHRYFPKIRPHMVEFTYKPAYITEITNPNPDTESELAHLYKFMDAHDGWKKLLGQHRDEWDLSLGKKRALEKLRKQEALEEIG